MKTFMDRLRQLRNGLNRVEQRVDGMDVKYTGEIGEARRQVNDLQNTADRLQAEAEALLGRPLDGKRGT